MNPPKCPDPGIDRTREPVTNRRDDCPLKATFTADQAKTVKQLLCDVTEGHPEELE